MATKKELRYDAVGLLIGGGVLLGLGYGFLVGNVVAGVLLGIGGGLVAGAITAVYLQKR